MIRNFKDRRAKAIFEGHTVKNLPMEIQKRARAKLKAIDAAAELGDLHNVRGNRIEKLRAERSGQHSIRINDGWRICFKWRNGDALDVEIVNYH